MGQYIYERSELFWITILQVNTALSLFHPSEVNILQQLLKVGTEYGKIEDFIRRHRNVQDFPNITKRETAMMDTDEGNLKLHKTCVMSMIHSAHRPGWQ